MKKLIIGLFIIFTSLGLGVALYSRFQIPKTNEPSNEDIISAITNEFPIFLDDNIPVIEVTEKERFENKWYVITIKSIHEKEAFVPIKTVIVSENTSNNTTRLRIVLGPDARFTESSLLQYNVPDSVILELQES